MSSRNKVDKRLGAALSKEVLAAYKETAGVRKRAADRAAALEAAPKKRSSRLQACPHTLPKRYQRNERYMQSKLDKPGVLRIALLAGLAQICANRDT